MRRPTAVVVCLLAAAAAVPAADGPPAGRLRGEIKRDRLHAVAGATVVAVREEPPPALAVTLSDRRGAFAFDGLEPGAWTVLAAEGGVLIGRVPGVAVRGPFRAVADVEAGAPAGERLRVALPAGDGPCAVAVRAVDPRFRPMSGVLVEVEPVAHRADPVAARTGQDGEARFGPVACGAWRVRAARAGWITLALPEVSWPAGEARILLRLLPVDRETPPPLDELLPPPELLEPATEPARESSSTRS
ncbi:MAG: carboxypeptidase regulatory-like domain-containing protein [Acidobacteria bacterium]|nr:MAG: carboxypeptidase regulatory-like domain-containing protein [Acidobacteriota bacterium]